MFYYFFTSGAETLNINTNCSRYDFQILYSYFSSSEQFVKLVLLFICFSHFDAVLGF